MMKSKNVLVVNKILVGVIAGLAFAPNLLAATNTNNVVSTSITSPGILQTVSAQYNDLMLGRIDTIRSGGMMDSNAMVKTDSGVWFNTAWTGLKNTLDSTQYHGDYNTFLMGGDLKIDDTMTVGLGFGFETSKMATDFNNGSEENNGWTVLPYLAYDLGDGMKLDLDVGYNWSEYSMYRQSATSPAGYTANPDARRWNAAMSLSKDCAVDNYLVDGRFSLSYVKERLDSFTETGSNLLVAQQNSKLGTIRVGGTAGYNMNHWVPYVLANYVWDFTNSTIATAATQSQPANDKSAVEIGVGLSLRVADTLVGKIEAKTQEGRSNYDNDTVIASLRWDM